MSRVRPGPRVLVLPDPAEVAERAAGLVAEAARSAVGRAGRFVVALCGGSTPGPLVRLLASPAYDHGLPWERTHLVWGDERCVPATDPRSNFHLAWAAGLLDRPLAGVHRIPGELGPEEGARRYEETLRDLFAERDRPDPPPIDVVLLGLGEDGHTASLFPDSSGWREGRRWVTPVEPHGGVARVSLTLPVLLAAVQVVFLVTGAAKAGIVERVLEGPTVDLPAAMVLWAAPAVTLVLDEEAAAGWSGGRHGVGAGAGGDGGRDTL